MKKDPIFPIFNQWKKEISQVYTLTIFMEIMLKDPNKTLEIIDKLLKDFPNKSSKKKKEANHSFFYIMNVSDEIKQRVHVIEAKK